MNIAETVKNFFRKRSLKKNHSESPTGLLPYSEIHSAVAFIDVEDPTFDSCKAVLQTFFRERGIKGEIFFLDFRKLGDGERLITSITNTILKSDLNWFGQPNEEKVRLLLDCHPDVFISLIDKPSFPLEFLANVSNAKFKIGRIPMGDTFDMVISDPAGKELSEEESFSAIRSFMEKIQ